MSGGGGGKSYRMSPSGGSVEVLRQKILNINTWIVK